MVGNVKRLTRSVTAFEEPAMKTGNAGLFKRLAAVDDAMVRAAMPKTSASDDAVVAAAFVVERQLVRSVGGTRLVKPLVANVAERMVANG